MSKLGELIAELCPNGVAMKKLREVSYMQRGTSLTRAKAVEGEGAATDVSVSIKITATIGTIA